MKGPIAIDFLEKGTAVNNASNFQLLMQNSPYLLNNPRTPFIEERQWRKNP